jgi:hypothetical protein
MKRLGIDINHHTDTQCTYYRPELCHHALISDHEQSCHYTGVCAFQKHPVSWREVWSVWQVIYAVLIIYGIIGFTTLIWWLLGR